MRETGKMTFFMAMEHITLTKVMFIKDNFIMVKPMGMVLQLIMMVAYLKENIKMAKSMEWAFILLLKAKLEWENGEKVKE